MLQEGRFGWCGRSGMALSDGYYWTRRNGGYNFYLGRQALSEIDFDHPMAVCEATVKELEIGGVFAAGQDYWVAVRAVSQFGLESAGYSWVRVRTDGLLAGKMAPDQVRNVRTCLTYNGMVRLEWDYEPRAGIVRPGTFNIYVTLAGVPFNYLSPVATVAYREGRRTYLWNSSDLGSPYPMKFVIRAVTADGIDDGSQRYITARGDIRYPGDAEDLGAEQA